VNVRPLLLYVSSLTRNVNIFPTRGVISHDTCLVDLSSSGAAVFTLVGLLVRGMVLLAVLTVRLMYWTLKAMIMLTVALAAAISTSRASHDRKALHRKPAQR
jgi:hypothetical protein